MSSMGCHWFWEGCLSSSKGCHGCQWRVSRVSGVSRLDGVIVGWGVNVGWGVMGVMGGKGSRGV